MLNTQEDGAKATCLPKSHLTAADVFLSDLQNLVPHLTPTSNYSTEPEGELLLEQGCRCLHLELFPAL